MIDDNISLQDIFEEEDELYMGWDIDDFRSAYEEFWGTNNMWAELLVLVYASIVGIVIPVTWRSYGCSPNKTMILCLFLSQLVALFI